MCSRVQVSSERLVMDLADYPSIPTAERRLAIFKEERDTALARGGTERTPLCCCC